jgi:hypothetical protein
MGERSRRAAVCFVASLFAGGSPSRALAQVHAVDVEPSRVFVHLDAGDGVVLVQETDEGYHRMCVAPCDAELVPTFRYRLSGGAGLSDVFTLAAPPGARETITVESGGRTRLVVGIVLIPSSLILAPVSLGIAALSALSDTGDPPLLWTGGALFIGSVVGLITGIVLVAGNAGAKNTVEQHVDAVTAPRDPDLSLLRPTPIWNDARRDAPRGLPPPIGIPLLRGEF